MKLTLVGMHDSAPHPNKYREIEGSTREELAEAIRNSTFPPGYYAAYAHMDGKTVWREDGEWTDEATALGIV